MANGTGLFLPLYTKIKNHFLKISRNMNDAETLQKRLMDESIKGTIDLDIYKIFWEVNQQFSQLVTLLKLSKEILVMTMRDKLVLYGVSKEEASNTAENFCLVKDIESIMEQVSKQYEQEDEDEEPADQEFDIDTARDHQLNDYNGR